MFDRLCLAGNRIESVGNSGVISFLIPAEEHLTTGGLHYATVARKLDFSSRSYT
jgi:hypothetical protein